MKIGPSQCKMTLSSVVAIRKKTLVRLFERILIDIGFKIMLDIGKLHEEIRNSEALKIDFRLQALEVNHYVVQRNFQELMRMLEAAQNPDAFLVQLSRNPYHV